MTSAKTDPLRGDPLGGRSPLPNQTFAPLPMDTRPPLEPTPDWPAWVLETIRALVDQGSRPETSATLWLAERLHASEASRLPAGDLSITAFKAGVDWANDIEGYPTEHYLDAEIARRYGRSAVDPVERADVTINRGPTRGGVEMFVSEGWRAAAGPDADCMATLSGRPSDPDDEQVRVRPIKQDDALLAELRCSPSSDTRTKGSCAKCGGLMACWCNQPKSDTGTGVPPGKALHQGYWRPSSEYSEMALAHIRACEPERWVVTDDALGYVWVGPLPVTLSPDNKGVVQLMAELSASERATLTEIDNRDRREDQIQAIHVALGGDGEWSSAKDLGDDALELIAAAEADTKRLDWLSHRMAQSRSGDWKAVGLDPTELTLRDAIDARSREGQTHG